MQHAVFHTIAFLAFSCFAFSTLAIWCRKFMSRIFHPCNMVPHFHVSHFPPLQSGAAFSCLTFSTPATWCRIFMSRIFSVPQCSCVLIRNISMLEICIWAYTKMANPHSPVTCTGCIAYDQQWLSGCCQPCMHVANKTIQSKHVPFSCGNACSSEVPGLR